MEVGERRKEVARLWREGLTAKEIGVLLGASRATISMDVHHLRQVGVDLPSRRKSSGTTGRVLLRRMEVAALWENGRTSREIADHLGCDLTVVLGDIRWLRIAGDLDEHDPQAHPARVQRREEVARLWREGRKADEIAKALGVRRSTVYLDLDRLRAEGERLDHRIPALVGNDCQRRKLRTLR